MRASTREEFIQQMRDALGEEIENPPTPDQLRRFFGTLNGRTQDAIEAFESYASLFLIHPTHTGDSDDASVTYWGGGSEQFFDGMDEEYPALLMMNEQYIVDCEGFANIGSELLQSAGFTFNQFIVAVPLRGRIEGEPRRYTGPRMHVIAELSIGGRRRFISNNRVYNTPQGAVSDLAGWNAFDSTNVRFGRGPTVREAAHDAHSIIVERQSDRFHVDRVAPLRPRSTFVPPTRRTRRTTH